MGRTSLTRRSRDYPALLLLLLLAACSLPATAPTRTSLPVPPGSRPVQTGIASWYGPGFHGKISASGAVYDQHELSAAHQTLPLGTRIMVTNLNNGKSAVVTVRDRGPFAKGRIVDLSYAAAQSLGMIGSGTAPVRLEVLDGKLDKVPERLDYTLQVGSFTDMDKAVKLKDLLGKKYPQYSQFSIVAFQKEDNTYYRVQGGLFTDRGEAEAQARRLSGEGYPVVIMEKW
ncbi:MAG TPA: septal ring lytic transglycosylase RlpA family protein [Candidatus Binatia bacterium]